MRIIFLGAPGSGKGTQAQLLRAHYGIAHISTGDLLRAAVAAGTPLGLEVKAVMDRGELVSDAQVLGLLKERLAQPDAARGFILDGYPRNLAQNAAFAELLAELGQPLDAAVYIEVPEALLVERIASRARAEGRADDSPETVRNRLAVYHAQTAPVVEHYAAAGRLKRVDGVGEINEILDRLKSALDDE